MITQTCGLGDTFIKDSSDAINKALKRMDAPFFMNCVKVTKKNAKRDSYKVGWGRFSEITCATGGHINNRAVKPMELDKWGKKWYGRSFSITKLKKNPESFATEMLKLENKTADGRKITVQKAKTEQKKAKVQQRKAKVMAKKQAKKTPKPQGKPAPKAQTATKRRAKKVFILKSLRPKKKVTVIRSLKRDKAFSGEKQDAFIKFVQKKFMKLKLSWYREIRGGKDPRALTFKIHLEREFENKYKAKKSEAGSKKTESPRPAPRPTPRPERREEPRPAPRPKFVPKPRVATPRPAPRPERREEPRPSGKGKSAFEKLMEMGG